MAREMIENERSTAINPSNRGGRKSLSVRQIGLWLGFHSIDQQTYLDMIRAYADALGLAMGEQRAALEAASLEWSVTRGSRSGRVAWQFIVDAAGRDGISIRRKNSGQVVFRIDGLTRLPDFKMQLRLINPACHPDRADHRPLFQPLTFFNADIAEMCIGRNPAAFMLDQHKIAKCLQTGTDKGHFTTT